MVAQRPSTQISVALVMSQMTRIYGCNIGGLIMYCCFTADVFLL